jgi:hypothetical protein
MTTNRVFRLLARRTVVVRGSARGVRPPLPRPLRSCEHSLGAAVVVGAYSSQERALALRLVMLVHHVRCAARTICRILRDFMFALSFMSK